MRSLIACGTRSSVLYGSAFESCALVLAATGLTRLLVAPGTYGVQGQSASRSCSGWIAL